MTRDKPDFVTNGHLEYLDELRESGETNMYGGGAYLQHNFDMDCLTARKTLSYWMETFSERHPNG